MVHVVGLGLCMAWGVTGGGLAKAKSGRLCRLSNTNECVQSDAYDHKQACWDLTICQFVKVHEGRVAVFLRCQWSQPDMKAMFWHHHLVMMLIRAMYSNFIFQIPKFLNGFYATSPLTNTTHAPTFISKRGRFSAKIHTAGPRQLPTNFQVRFFSPLLTHSHLYHLPYSLHSHINRNVCSSFQVQGRRPVSCGLWS